MLAYTFRCRKAGRRLSDAEGAQPQDDTVKKDVWFKATLGKTASTAVEIDIGGATR